MPTLYQLIYLTSSFYALPLDRMLYLSPRPPPPPPHTHTSQQITSPPTPADPTHTLLSKLPPPPPPPPAHPSHTLLSKLPPLFSDRSELKYKNKMSEARKSVSTATHDALVRARRSTTNRMRPRHRKTMMAAPCLLASCRCCHRRFTCLGGGWRCGCRGWAGCRANGGRWVTPGRRDARTRVG